MCLPLPLSIIIRKAKEKGIKVTAEATPHHLTMTEESLLGYNTLAKVKPPLRREEDRQALIQGVADGTIDAIVTDHSPHTDAEKMVEFDKAPFGISGFETALSLLLGLVRDGYISLYQLIDMLTENQPGLLVNPTLARLKLVHQQKLPYLTSKKNGWSAKLALSPKVKTPLL